MARIYRACVASWSIDGSAKQLYDSDLVFPGDGFTPIPALGGPETSYSLNLNGGMVPGGVLDIVVEIAEI